jgi:hypothetical protein
MRPEGLLTLRAELLSRIDRFGADCRSRKNALRALYAAAGRLSSEPSMIMSPAVVRTCHFHARPRFSSTTSKIGNLSGIVNRTNAAVIRDGGAAAVDDDAGAIESQERVVGKGGATPPVPTEIATALIDLFIHIPDARAPRLPLFTP